MPNRLTILYNQDSGGWSETHWRNDETLAVTKTAADALLTLRSASLNFLTEIYGYRITDIVTKRSEFYLTPPVLGGKLGAGLGADFPWTGAFFSVQLQTGKTMPFLLRGIADSEATDLPGHFGDFTANQTTKAYLDALFKSGTWGTRILDTVPATNPSFPLESVAIAGELWTFTSTGNNLVPGDYALFTGMQQYTMFPRRLRVIKSTANTFTVRVKCSCGTFLAGTVRREKFTWVAYANWTVKGVRKRDTGRPFGLLSGRRRA